MMYGDQQANFCVNALIKFGLDTYRESYFKVHIVEKGVALAYIDAIGRFSRNSACNFQTIKNHNLSIFATNVQGTIAVSGVTNADNLVWTAELLN